MKRAINVRKTTQFKRSVKAISPVIATLLMIAIAVVASLVVYAWVSGYIGFQTNKAGESIALPSLAGGQVTDPVENLGNLIVYVQNVGQGTVEVSAVYVDDVLIDDTALSYSPNPPGKVISEGNTVEITIDGDFDLDERHDIKVTTTSGTSMTLSNAKPGTSTSGPSGPGALTASVTPVGPLTMTTSGSQLFTVTSDGGTGSKSYQWYLDDSAVPGETATTYTYTATLGSHTVYCKVTDSAAPPSTVDSNTVSITVTDALAASVTPGGPLTMDAGQQQVFTASASGGTGPYSYAWYLDGSAISGQTASTYTYTAAVGSDSIYCKVTDSASATADSNTVSITINAAMSTPSITPAGPLTMTAGNTQTFTLGAVTGGSGAKSYQWFLDGSAVSGQTDTTYVYTAATAGSPHTVYCTVTDSASTPVTLQSNTVSITVNPAQAQVTYVSAGTGSGVAGSGSSNNPSPGYPSSFQANDLILLQVVVRDTSSSPTTPAGFTALYSQESSGEGRQWIYYKFATGSESGTLTIDVSGSSSVAARMYAFRNVASSSFTEGGGFGSYNNWFEYINAQSVMTSGNNRLAVTFEFVTDNIGLDDFSGESNGNWQLATTEFEYDRPSSGDDLTLALQIATIASPTTISGGSDYTNWVDTSYGVRAFALKP